MFHLFREKQSPIILRMRNVVFLSIGIALIVLSAWVDSFGFNTLAAIALNLGLVSLAVLLVDQIWRICGGNPIDHQITSLHEQVKRLSKSIDTIEDREQIGLKDAYTNLANFGTQSDWERLLESAQSRVDIMGRTTFGWSYADNLKEIILRKVQDDTVTFRWMLMSKTNNFLSMLETVEPHSLLSSKVNSMHAILSNCRNSLPEKYRDHFQVKIFSHIPLTCGILRIDNTIYVTQYLFSSSSTHSPFYSVYGTNAAWSKIYLREFDTIWNDSQNLFP